VIRQFSLLGTVLGAALWAAPGAVAGAGEPVANQYIVVLHDGVDAAAASDALARDAGIAPVYVYSRALSGFSALIPAGKVEAVRSDPRVASVAPDRTLTATAEAAASLAALTGTRVAVMDTGADFDDPRLERIEGGATFVSGEESPAANGADDNGHGTASAMAVAAAAPAAALQSVKVLGTAGAGTFSDFIAGLDWILSDARGRIDAAFFSLGADCGECGPLSADPAVAALRAAIGGARRAGVRLYADRAAVDAGIPGSFEGVEALEAGGSLSAAAAGVDAAFKLGEVYAFPNPAVAGAKPRIHVEVGIADSVNIEIYDVAGRRVGGASLGGTPPVVDDGTGPSYAYEYTWDGRIASGVYLYVVRAEKAGYAALTATGKLAVVR
jgi:hypothetical protein